MVYQKNNALKIKDELKKGKKMVAMLAPSYVAEFDYPSILSKMKSAGFDKIVELTFGAKMINREYHRVLTCSKGLVIASVCPGIVEVIKGKYPQYAKNLVRVDSPMVAMAKICKKFYPEHKTVFISPCDYKKLEAERCDYVNYSIDYGQLRELMAEMNAKEKKKGAGFDRFYNEFTKIYPLAGGLSKTVHLNGILKKSEILKIDGIGRVMKFLENPDKKIRFLDATFCAGGCIGGPCLTRGLTIEQRKKRVMDYMKIAETEDIPKGKMGLVKNARNIKFTF